MPDISLTDPNSIVAEINRRQKLADLLQQQSMEPIQIQSYKGIQAPIPWAAVLAKALQAGVGAWQDRKAEEGRTEANTRAQQLLSAYSAPQQAAQSAQPTGLPPPMPRPEPMAQPRNDDYAAMAAPIAQPQAPPMPPPAQMNAPQGPAPQAGPAPNIAPPPVAAPPPEAPTQAPIAAPQAPVDHLAAQEAAAQAQLTKALELQHQMGQLGFPKAADTYVETAKKAVERVQNLRDAHMAKEEDRLQDVEQAKQLINILPITPDQKALLGPTAAIVGTKGIMPAVQKIQEYQLTPQERYLSPEETVKNGFNPGSVVAVDGVSGKIHVVFDPTPTQLAKANLALHKQEVGLSGARLGLERQRFAADQQAKNDAVLDPVTLQQLAMQARAGDRSVFQNLGRGIQGAKNLVALRRAVFDPALGPMTGTQMAQMNAQFLGAQSAARAAGTRAGQAAVGAEEVPLLAQQSNDAYSKLTRDQLVPFNKLRVMVERGTSSPQQADSFAADEAVITAWSRTLTPTGAPTDARQRLGERILSQAVGQDAHRAVLNRFISEINAVKQGAGVAVHGGSAPAGQLSAPSAHQPYADPAKEARYQAWLETHPNGQ